MSDTDEVKLIPLEAPVTHIKFRKEAALNPKCLFSGKCGDFVFIRPCGAEYEEKTFLGILLGEIAQTISAHIDRESGALVIGHSLHNPAIFVPDLNKVIYGMESWWGSIKDESQLRKITDQDIDNVWYVKVLRRLNEERD